MYELLLPMPEQKPTAPSRALPTGWRLLAPNLLLFQAGWFAAVLGAANGMAWLGPAVITAILAFHLYRASERAMEAGLVLCVLLVGLAFESLLAFSGWVAYPGHESSIAPLWMVALWANFAATLNVALRSLRSRAWLLAALGLVGGPLAYWGGASLGAMTWLQVWPVLMSLALGWAILTPLLGRLAMFLDGYRHGH
jgi:hypothetical protein